MGQYVPILSAVSAIKHALGDWDLTALAQPLLSVLMPVAIGAGIGLVVVTNALRWLLKHHEKTTLGVLLGLLLGSVVGLWPFQKPIDEPTLLVDTTLKGQRVVARVDLPQGRATEPLEAYPTQARLAYLQTGKPVKPEDYPTVYFTPAPWQAGLSVGLIALGFGLTMLVARLGRESPPADAPSGDPHQPSAPQ
jgi:putative membrane protein